MDDKIFKITFNNKEEMRRYGADNLYKQLLSILEGIDEKYIIKAHGIAEELYTLFGFSSNEELKEKLNDKPISELKAYTKIISDNIFKSLDNSDIFISRCSHKGYNNLEIKFRLVTFKSFGEYVNGVNHSALEFEIMSIQKSSGCGSGHSFSFDLVDSNKLHKINEEVTQMNIPQSVKQMYIDYFNSESEENLNIDIVKNWVIEGIVEHINDYIYEIEDKFKNYESLKEQGFKEILIDFIKEKEFTRSISDAIAIDYCVRKATSYDVFINGVDCKEGEYYTDENRLSIKFLGNEIKTISKSSYTVYEIN